MAELSYLYTPVTEPLQYKTLHQRLQEQVQKCPNKEVCVFRHLDERRHAITTERLYRNAKTLAKYLTKNGIKHGDHVGILGSNSIEWIVGEFGILTAGAVAIHLAVATKNANDVKEICVQSDCQAILIDVENEQLRSTIETTFLEEGLLVVHLQSHGKQEKNSLQYILSVPEENVDLPQTYPEDDALVFTTSGSTGKPKMVVHSHVSIQPIIRLQQQTEGSVIGYDDRPFCWIGGNPLVPIANGDVRVFMKSNIAADRKNISAIWKIIREERCTFSLLMPYVLEELAELAIELKRDDFRLKRIMTGGQIVDVFTNVVGVLCEHLIIGYGSTECAAISCNTLYTSNQGERGDVGRPFEGIEVRIVDERGTPTMRDTIGSIQVRSQVEFDRYLGNQELTSKTKTNKGWIKTGDIGMITSSGRIIIRGREKDIISRGTRKIIPALIENTVEELPQLYSVCVIPVPDAKLGEEVCVCYIPHTGENMEPVAVKEYCETVFLRKEDSIDGIGEMPTYFLRFEEFPVLSTGKVDKRTLTKYASEMLEL